MSDRAADSGLVVAVDIEPRFLEKVKRSNLEIRQLDIATTELEPNFYDLIHVRAVLMPVRDRDKQRLLEAQLCSNTDINQFLELTTDPTTWMLDYSIMSVWGQKSR